jgi:hypothetical protein
MQIVFDQHFRKKRSKTSLDHCQVLGNNNENKLTEVTSGTETLAHDGHLPLRISPRQEVGFVGEG